MARSGSHVCCQGCGCLVEPGRSPAGAVEYKCSRCGLVGPGPAAPAVAGEPEQLREIATWAIDQAMRVVLANTHQHRGAGPLLVGPGLVSGIAALLMAERVTLTDAAGSETTETQPGD